MFITKDKNFYKDTLHIALPLAMQFLLANLLNLMDTIMIGKLGELPLAGVSAGNNVFFIFNLFIFGVASGSAIFAAQYYGSGNHNGIRQVTGMGLFCSVTFSVVFMVLAYYFANSLIGVFSKDAAVIEYGSIYLKIVLWSYLPTAVTEIYFAVLKSSGEVKVPLYVSIAALAVNTVLNYVLIYGKLGFPAYGVAGAAIATVIARVLQVGLLFLLIYNEGHIIACKITELFKFTKKIFGEFIKISYPVILNESMWAVGTVCYNVVYGRMGTKELAVVAIVSNAERIFMFAFMGIGYAALALIGKKIGEGKEALAYEYAISYVWITLIFSAVLAGIIVVISPYVLALYNISADTYSMAYKVMLIMAIYITFKMFNFVTIVGILRSGGDTMWAAAIDLGSVWLIGIPIAILSGLVFKLPMHIVYALILTEELFKGIASAYRLLSKKWIKSLS